MNTEIFSSRFTAEQQIIVDKLTGLDELLTDEEAKLAQTIIDEDSKKMHYWRMRPFDNICFIPTVEFVDGLSKIIKQLTTEKVVEVCAGKGKLSYHLQKQGINITPIDKEPQSDMVERFYHMLAIEVHKPKLVIGAWLYPEGYKQEHSVWNDIVKYYVKANKVDHFIEIGAIEKEGNYNSTGSSIRMRELIKEQKRKYEVTSFPELVQHVYSGVNEDLAKHVTLITRK